MAKRFEGTRFEYDNFGRWVSITLTIQSEHLILSDFAQQTNNSFLTTFFSGRSMVITGCSPWTLYELSHFRGESACFYPKDTSRCHPSFFIDDDAMQGWAGRVSSVRRGCYTQKKYHGRPLTFEETPGKVAIGSNGKALGNEWISHKIDWWNIILDFYILHIDAQFYLLVFDFIQEYKFIRLTTIQMLLIS